MHYPSLTRKLLLATILSAGTTLPSCASDLLDDAKTATQGTSTQAEITDINVNTTDVVAAASTESAGLFGWIFGSQKTTPSTSLDEQKEVNEVAKEIIQAGPSETPLETPTITATSGWSLNPLTLFGLIGSGTSATPQTLPVDSAPSEIPVTINAADTSANSQDEESGIEGEIWQPEPQASTSQQPSATPFGTVSHELYGFDPSQSTLYDLQAALDKVKEKKRSFTHNYPIESRLRSVTLPCGDLFSVYPAAKYTLALGDMKIDFSGQELDAALSVGKSLTGLSLFSVQTNVDETALFKMQSVDNTSFIPSNHLFFDPLKAGAELQDTPTPFGLFFADEKSFILGQDDLVTFKLFGENFKTTAESLRRVGSPFVENFLQTYQQQNVLRVNRISRDGKFVYKRSQ